MMHRPSASSWRVALIQVVSLLSLPFPVRGQALALEDALVGRNHGLDDLSLLIAVPLTKNNVKVPDPGWLHLASALMAMDHFNARNAIVVPELADLHPSCQNIRFGMNNITVLDTGTNAHISMKDFATNIPNAIAGPYNEIPAFELSVFGTSLQIPVVSHNRATDPALLDPQKHPYFSQVSADPYAEMEFVGSFLNHTQRSNYIAIVYASTPNVMQKVDILRAILDQGMVHRQVKTYGYHTMDTKGRHDDSIRYALARVKETGFRTIVLLPDDIQADVDELQEAAEDLELNRGDHFWVVSGGAAELSAAEQIEILRTSNATHGNRSFFKGAAYLSPYDGFDFGYWNAFQGALVQQDKAFMERLDALTPIPDYFDWSFAADSDHVLETILGEMLTWWQGTSYLYDAVISIGIGACNALMDANSSEISGEMLLQGVRSVDFSGASGRVVFKGNNSGARVASTIPMAVVNLLPEGAEYDFDLLSTTEILKSEAEEFEQLGDFMYADGSNEPPVPLRDIPEQNYLDCAIRFAGLALMGVALVVVFFSAVWVFLHRDHSVVIAAQPIYLYALCLGSAVISLNIYFISPDEGQGWTEEMLDKSCVAAVWVNAIGMLLIYGSIFTKHWRVDRLMRQKNRRMSLGLVVAPLTLLVTTLIILQALWTVDEAYGWERVEIDEMTGESIGSCSGNVAPCLYLTGFFLFVPVALAGAFAYKTLGVDDLYSESKWVLIFILVQFQVYLVGAPVLQILRSVSTDGRFIGEALLIWTVPMTTMGLIVAPKVWLVRQMQLKADAKTGDEAVSSDLQSSNDSRDSPPTEGIDGSEGTVPSSGRPAAQATSGATPDSVLSGPRIQIVTFD